MNISKYKKCITLRSYLVGLLMLAFSAWLTYSSVQESRYFGAILFVLLSATVWYFTYLFPSYQIENSHLRVITVNGVNSIEINSVRKIEPHISIYGLGIFTPIQKGLLIHYGSFEDVFVNPEKQENFVQQLLAVNPNIEIIQKGKQKLSLNK